MRDPLGPWQNSAVTSSLRISCASCGAIEVPVPDAVLVLTLDAPDGDGRNIVEFRCPNCSLPGAQRVGERATRLLSEAGVQVAVPERHDREVPASDAARRGPEPDPH
jgi:hypothetical protein